MGAGTVGLLAALALRLRGLEVTSFARSAAPNPNSERLDRIGVRYVSTRETPLGEAAKRYGPFDLVFEATGSGPVAFEAMEHLGRERVTARRRRSACPAATHDEGRPCGNGARRDLQDDVPLLAVERIG